MFIPALAKIGSGKIVVYVEQGDSSRGPRAQNKMRRITNDVRSGLCDSL